MKLVILGGVAAKKVRDLLASSMDNLDITLYGNLTEFVEQTSIRPPQIDRLIIMQDAYFRCEGDPSAALGQFAHYLNRQYPETRVINIGIKEEFLDNVSQTLASPLCLTLRSTKGSASVFSDIATLPLERLRTAYSDAVVSAGMESVSFITDEPKQETATKPAVQPNQDKKKHGGLFGGRRKDNNSTFAGTSPAQSLTAGQSSGFGANQGSNNPFANNSFAKGNQNIGFGGFGNTQSGFGGATSEESGSDTPASTANNQDSTSNKETEGTQFGGFSAGASAFGTGVSAFGSKDNISEPENNSFGDNTSAFGTNTNSFGDNTSAFGTNTNAFDNQAEGTIKKPVANVQPAKASSVKEKKSKGKLFGRKNKEEKSQSNTVQSVNNELNDTAKDDSDFDNTFGSGDDNFKFDANAFKNGFDDEPAETQGIISNTNTAVDDFEEADEAANPAGFNQTAGSAFAEPFSGTPQQGLNQFQDAFETNSPEKNASVSTSQFDVQEPQNLAQDNSFGTSENQPRRGQNALNDAENDIEEVEEAPISPFATPMQNFGTSREFSQSDVSMTGANNSDFEEVDDSMGFVNSPYMQPATPERNLDMSKLQAHSGANQYDFKSAVANTKGKAPKRGSMNVEEAVANQTQMGIIDDTSYQMQAAPARVIERVVEKEVYIETGGETPAQKLLDAGKQVNIIVTGDRRSGVTYTCLTLASLYARRYSTLLVDLDTETCGGQLYQDLDSLLSEDENVQHGVLRAKNATLLSNLVHHDTSDGYDYLFSLLGNEPATPNDIKGIQNALMTQRDYQLVIVDCPWSKISLLDELVSRSKILVCVDPDVTGCHNTVELLNDLQIQDRVSMALEKTGAYIAKQGGSVDNLTQNMRWISEAFEAKNIDWASMRILGESSREGLVNCMKKL